MNVKLNDDFQDILRCFNACEVDYLIVGGYAVIHYGHSRTTGDIDIWVRKSEANYLKINAAFFKFGMSVFDMTFENFMSDEMDVFSFGRSPVAIDILTEVKGLEFEEAYLKAIAATWDGVPVKVIDFKDLIRAKKTSARYKDLDDLENIKEPD